MIFQYGWTAIVLMTLLRVLVSPTLVGKSSTVTVGQVVISNVGRLFMLWWLWQVKL